MTFDDFTDILRDYIGTDNPEKVLEVLKVLLKPLENRHFQNATMIGSRLSNLRQSIYTGQMDGIGIERMRICNALYELLDELEDDRSVESYFERDWMNIVRSCGLEKEQPTIKGERKLGLRLLLHSNDERAPGPVTELECEALIGRRSDCLIKLNDQCISRRHARIFYSEGQLWVEDFDSDNGTYVNDRQVIAPTPLVDGCRLRFYDIAFWVKIHQ